MDRHGSPSPIVIPPTLFEWAGGRAPFKSWVDAVYDRVESDDLLAPLFAGGVSEEHRALITLWWVEVFGGPADFTTAVGGYERTLDEYRKMGITPEQRRRFAQTMDHAADVVGLPDDPEFRAAFMGCVEWSTRVGLEPPAEVVEHVPVPRWGWGVMPPRAS